MARKNRSLALKAERAKRERRDWAQDQAMRSVIATASDVVIIKAEHVGWRTTVRHHTIDTSRKSIVATHW